MKLKYIAFWGIAMGAGAFMSSAAVPTGTYRYQFAKSSLLSEGTWVKVRTSDTGVYEITYDELRAMGFSDPSKVTAFGSGAVQASDNFYVSSSSTASRSFEDTPQPVAVRHSGDKMYFYAQGPSTMTYRQGVVGSSAGRGMLKTSKNIYTDEGYYLLTDSRDVKEMQNEDVSDMSAAVARDYGYGYIYHEKDLYQTNHGVGRTWWGEDLLATPEVSFTETLPYAVTGKNMFINGALAFPGGLEGTVDIYANTDSRTVQMKRETSGFQEFATFSTPVLSDSKVTIKFKKIAADTKVPYLAIDYWTVLYPKSIASAPGYDQEILLMPYQSDSMVSSVAVPAGAEVWDVTTPSNPTVMKVQGSSLYYHELEGGRQFMVFDPAVAQKKINGYTAVANQDLHALQEENVDMVIFTMPWLESYAREIAELHSTYDGMNVVVLTPEQVYDEFTAGRPDPMAHRALAKMLYQSSNQKFKYVMFMGPLYGDFRNINGVDRPDGMIGMQEPTDLFDTISKSMSGTASVTAYEGAFFMDYYGTMGDYIRTSSCGTLPLEVAVGVLPCTTEYEAALYVSKVREHLSKEDKSWLVNETMVMTCNGDNHLHDRQGVDISNDMSGYFAEFGSDVVNKMVWPEPIGLKNAAIQTAAGFNSNKLLSVYIGHAGRAGYGDYFTNADFGKLDNEHLGFMIFAGCELTKSDCGAPGIGQLSVLNSPRGLLGSICSTRTVYSTHNEDLTRAIIKSLFKNLDGTPRTETPTIGEVYTEGKTLVSNSSEISYILVSDPALRVPVALRKIDLDVTTVTGRVSGGEVISVKGKVLDSSGNVDNTYDGNVVIKVAEPEKQLSFTASGSGQKIVRYADTPLVSVKAEVSNGEFAVKVPLPATCDNFRAVSDAEPVYLPMYVGSYSSDLGLGASGFKNLRMSNDDGSQVSASNRDNQVPSVAVSYDDVTRTVKVSASDNIALIPGIGVGKCVVMQVDGNEVNTTAGASSDGAVTSYEGSVSVARLAPGKHTLTYVASDLAGNSTAPVALDFTIKGSDAIELSAQSSVAVDEITFGVVADSLDGLQLVLIAEDGTEVYTGSVDQNSVIADVSGLDAGIYRAFVRHGSAGGAWFYSNKVDFTVID